MRTAPSVCRPDYSYLCLALLSLILGGGFAWSLTQPSKGFPHGIPLLSPVPIGVISFTVVVAVAVTGWMLINRISWDEEGIDWHALREKGHADWKEITDYGVQLPPTDRKVSSPLGCIHFRDGRILRFGMDWKNAKVLREAVERHATSAQVREWATFGIREIDEWPRTFTYPVKEAKFNLAFLGVMLVVLTGLIFFRALEKVPNTFATLGWQWGIASILIVLLVLSMGFAAVLVVPMPRFRGILQRSRDSITVSPTGIQYRNAETVIDATWNTVRDFYIEGEVKAGITNWCVVQPDGTEESIRFSSSITNAALLLQIITRYAPPPPGRTREDAWRTVGNDQDTLGTAADQWTGGSQGIGSRIYHYRTRTNRAMLWLLSAISLSVPISMMIHSGMEGTSLHISTGTIITFLLIAMLNLYSWWRYFAARVETDELGLIQYAPFAKHRLRWSEVQQWRVLGQPSSSILLEGTDGRHIRAWSTLADVEQFQEEIKQRTGLAPNSTTE